MNPKPFSSLNHFTVPVGTFAAPSSPACAYSNRCAANPNLGTCELFLPARAGPTRETLTGDPVELLSGERLGALESRLAGPVLEEALHGALEVGGGEQRRPDVG